MATPSGPPVLTLEAVNSLIPRLNVLVGRQLARRADIEALLKTLSAQIGEVPENFAPSPTDAPEVLAMKQDLLSRVEEYQKGWQALEELGAVLKDPRIGLLDFYGRVEGELVWLCWKYGESEVTHYHALNEGFDGRKSIRMSVKQRLLN